MAHSKMHAGHTGTRVGGLTENTRHSTMETTHNTKRQSRWRWRQQRTNDNLKGKPTTILTLWGAKVVCVQSFRPRWWRDTDGETTPLKYIRIPLKKKHFIQTDTEHESHKIQRQMMWFCSIQTIRLLVGSIFFCLPQQLGCDFLALIKTHVFENKSRCEWIEGKFNFEWKTKKTKQKKFRRGGCDG